MMMSGRRSPTASTAERLATFWTFRDCFASRRIEQTEKRCLLQVERFNKRTINPARHQRFDISCTSEIRRCEIVQQGRHCQEQGNLQLAHSSIAVVISHPLPRPICLFHSFATKEQKERPLFNHFPQSSSVGLRVCPSPLLCPVSNRSISSLIYHSSLSLCRIRRHFRSF